MIIINLKGSSLACTNLMRRRQSVLLLPHHNLRTILQRLRQMRGLDFFTPRQICNRARQFQDAMIGTRG